ncbi:unnamed protein product [Danaus chrysippus]|uniref:(African queen) hypothetical protein n=1 Tax=Danaus chrysippus TaxID=151541 RepID=A0A8J2QGM0_9NEOP|nr:unnamed protein product [Danaus chrysippus]
MVDKLPLLPEKDAVCADVKCVLQEVFRDSNYLPKVVEDNSDWVEKLSEDNIVLNDQELKLRDEHANRLSKDPLTNIYRLNSPRVSRNDQHSKWKEHVRLIERKDLKPTLKQDASGDNNLWVRNILNGSSGNLAAIKVIGSKIHPPAPLHISDDTSLQSISWGPVRQTSPPPSPSSSSATPVPDYIICIPSQLKFLNFNIGRLHTHTLRLINISKFEMRVSVRPPKRRELDVELCSRLVVTSGSAAEIKIHFRPKDVRELSDQLLVRVSSGQKLTIPIVCYMEPPTLNIIYPPGSLQLSSPKSTKTVSDVLDLGARLLGDVHQTPLVLKCGERDSSFFLLSEDAWLEYSIEVAIGTRDNIPMYGVVADRFFVTPVRWCGGGTVQGLALCRADTPGLHTASLKILCSTAIVRPLQLVADALLFSPKHITLKAQDKDYDICSEDDPACEYYVHLGTSYPNESLSATVTIFNHSSLCYNYHWSVRPWGVCSCWDPSYYEEGEDHDSDLCPGALHNKQQMKTETDNKQAEGDPSSAVYVEPPQGRLEPRRHIELCVRVPDAGGTPGLRRAVLMLILTDIPKESFPADYNPMIVSVNVLQEEAIPGVSKSWSREVCDVVCAEMEVWWTVVPVRFTLDPPLLLLPYSRRVKSVSIKLRVTQLYGISSMKAHFEMTTPSPAPPMLSPGQAYFTSATLPLTELPNEFPETSYIRLRSEQSPWCVSCVVSRWCSERAPGLRPTRCWLGVLPPGTSVRTQLVVLNDTHQHIHWWGACHRWYRERVVSPPCEDRPPCVDCCSRSCTCLLLTPSRGALTHKQRITLHYQANAPDSDGCVSTLVQVRRTAPDTSSVQSMPGSAARASLVTYRVLAPRLTLSVLPCGGDKRTESALLALVSFFSSPPGVGCALDSRSTAVLRPRSSLTVGDTSCCRLRITNTTPIPTHVSWEPALDEEEALKVVFIPEELKLGGYSQVTVMVTLEARRVVSRRLFVRRARVLHAYKPLYLLIDAAVSGVEVSVEFPIGGGDHTDSFVSIKMLQKENIAANISTRKLQSPSVAEMFAENDRKRAFQKEHTCTCKYEMVYIPPKKEPQKPTRDSEESPRVEIVESPPALTRVCPCSGQCKPQVPEDVDPYCIQFVGLPLRNVRSRVVTLRNTCRLNARWSCAVRRHERPRHRTVHTREEDQWSEVVHHPGYSLSCSPSHGSLAANTSACFTVSVFADTWGLYYDQIIIMSLPLVLHMDLPVLESEPEVIDFGFVSDNTCRKSYFTIKHSSPSAVIELVTSWSGDSQFDLWPSSLSLRPGVSERVYLQFTAKYDSLKL